MISFDIFICTFKRVESLDRCLSSFDEFKNLKNVTIYVVDNDPAGSAKSLVSLKYKHIKYINEKNKGLSSARNNAFKNGNGDYIAFIDDDEVVTIDWFRSAELFIETYACDVMFGGVKSIYPEGTPSWIIEVDAFSSTVKAHASVIDCSGAGNVFINRLSIINTGLEFDKSFSETGGEDSMLFRGLSKIGLKLLWNNHMWVYEHVEKDRLNEGYILKRAYRDGQCYARSYLAHASTIAKIVWFFKRLIKITYVTFNLLKSKFNKNKCIRINAQREFLKNIGQLSVFTGRFVKMYE